MSMTVVFQRTLAWWEPFLLRLCIALDAFIQAFFKGGVLGVTISSRIATAASHGHKWGIGGDWVLNRVWPFGPNKDTGESHCQGAIKNDCLRAILVLKELLGDSTVVKDRNLGSFKQEVLTKVTEILAKDPLT